MSNVRQFLIREGLMPGDMFRSEKLTRLANGAPCMNCTSQNGTTVSAHANEQSLDKGGHNKVHDCFIAFLCFACHSWLDQGGGKDPTGVYEGTRGDKALMWNNAYRNTMLYLFQTRKVKVA